MGGSPCHLLNIIRALRQVDVTMSQAPVFCGQWCGQCHLHTMPRKEREMWSIKKSGCDHVPDLFFLWPVMWSMSSTQYAKKGEGNVDVTTNPSPCFGLTNG